MLVVNISAPALELLSRAASSVEVCTVPAVPTQGAIWEEGRYKKKIIRLVLAENVLKAAIGS